MGVFGAFRRRRPEDAEARARVAAWVREVGGYGPETTVSVSEIVCADPACPGTETVILIMVPRRPTRACKVSGPVEAVDREGVASALSA
ncbi:MAG: hypothetical protein PGN34_11610 [Methylobacterium frigidaeris]